MVPSSLLYICTWLQHLIFEFSCNQDGHELQWRPIGAYWLLTQKNAVMWNVNSGNAYRPTHHQHDRAGPYTRHSDPSAGPSMAGWDAMQEDL